MIQGEANPELRWSVASETGFSSTMDASDPTGRIAIIDPSGTSLPDEKIAGRVFTSIGTDGSPASLTIQAVYPPFHDPADPEYDRYQYIVTQADGSPLCPEVAPAVPLFTPLATPIRAIAVRGAWNMNGVFYPLLDHVSFTCRTGVSAKCDRWGYGPNTTWPTTTAHGTPISVRGYNMHQSCTRMARADYCSQGVPNTLDGTPIYIEDNFHLRVPQPGYYPEAAWRDFAFDDRGTPGRPVVCLSKLRWSTLPLGGDCPLTVPDPRVTAKAKFCDDLTDAQLDAAGVVLFSSSSFIDVGLNTFYDPSTGKRLTTTQLQLQAYPAPARWLITPPAGVGFPIASPPAGDPRFEATLLTLTPPAGVDTSKLIKLHSYLCDSDLLTTATDQPSCKLIADEGLLYPPNTPGYAPLRRWRDRTTGHAWTTVTSPTTMWARRALMTEVIGGVVRAALDVNVRWTAVPNTTYALDIQLRTGEWIANCIAAATLGTATSVVFDGTCSGASNRKVNHNDITAFRMNYNGHYATQPYDGYSSDAYIPITGVTPPLTATQAKAALVTALNIKWNDLGNAIYALSATDNLGVSHNCVPVEFLANDVSYIHTGTCPGSGALPLKSLVEVQVCAFDKTTRAKRGCAAGKFDGRASTVALTIPQ